jgi:hypothetical protein
LYFINEINKWKDGLNNYENKLPALILARACVPLRPDNQTKKPPYFRKAAFVVDRGMFAKQFLDDLESLASLCLSYSVMGANRINIESRAR